MIRKIALFISLLFCAVTAHAAEMVNVEYIHKLIARDWGIDIQYNPALTNPKVAANMKYLLVAVDRANEILNEVPTTEYGDGEYATMYAADTVATNDAVARLIKKGKDYTFEVITTPDTDSFSFEMSAAGTFTVDWGDGEVQEIVRTDTESATYSHTYARARKYKIGFEGRATGYGAHAAYPAIRFANNQNVGGIRGSLGAIFSTIDDGSNSGQQPSFYHTFFVCNNLSGTIPENLFAGVGGQPIQDMFTGTFEICPKLTGTIPENLFAGIKGAPAPGMFYSTFAGTSLVGPIPAKLFAGIKGAPAHSMYKETFRGSSMLNGSIPENFFGDISGAVKPYMFEGTFRWCDKLSGPSAKINGKYLYEIWPDATTDDVGSCYGNATGLTDYANIPDVWK